MQLLRRSLPSPPISLRFSFTCMFDLSSLFLHSSQMISPSCYSTTTGEQLNGMSMSGQKQLFTSVCRSKPNGFIYDFLVHFISVKYVFCTYFIQETSTWLFPETFPFWNWDIRWYVKRFLHPDIVANYDYIFIWDEDLGVEHFNADE